MAISSLEQHIAEVVSRLSSADQQKVLDYARLLGANADNADTPQSPLDVWKRLAALFAPGELAELEQALAQDEHAEMTNE